MQAFHFDLPKCDNCLGEAPSPLTPPPPYSDITFTVHFRGGFRRFCTACVLKYHIIHFCPICYQLYDDEEPQPAIFRRVICDSCTATAHLSCLPPVNAAGTAAPPRCPWCENSEKDFRRPLLAAAQIAARTMTKVEKAVRATAEKKAADASRSRKEANDAMEKCATISSRLKNNNINIP